MWKLQFAQFKDSQKSLSEVLSHGELSIDEYMKWAAEYYKIPYLSDDFFAQTKNYKLILENPSEQWNEFFFPIHEWQGLLYVGCLEPQNLQHSKKSCMVLCSPKQLSLLWSKMESLEKTVVLTEFAIPQFEPLAPAATAPPATAEAAAPASAPVVMTLAPPPIVVAPDQSDTVFVPTSVPSAVDTASQKSALKINPHFSENNFDIPEITNVVRAPEKASNTNFTSTKTIMPFPDRTTQFTFIRTVYSEQVILEAKAKIQENTNPQDALISAFRILKDYYKKLMWVVRDQKGFAFPIACNTEWEFTEEAWNLHMDFKTPNPFRIAKLTQKPYHGPISKNRASDAFFKQWGDGSYPNVMSIVPVKLHGKVFGYFVGCDRGPHFNSQQSIELMDSVCSELIVAFVRIHKDLAKAS